MESTGLESPIDAGGRMGVRRHLQLAGAGRLHHRLELVLEEDGGRLLMGARLPAAAGRIDFDAIGAHPNLSAHRLTITFHAAVIPSRRAKIDQPLPPGLRTVV